MNGSMNLCCCQPNHYYRLPWRISLLALALGVVGALLGGMSFSMSEFMQKAARVKNRWWGHAVAGLLLASSAGQVVLIFC